FRSPCGCSSWSLAPALGLKPALQASAQPLRSLCPAALSGRQVPSSRSLLPNQIDHGIALRVRNSPKPHLPQLLAHGLAGNFSPRGTIKRKSKPATGFQDPVNLSEPADLIPPKVERIHGVGLIEELAFGGDFLRSALKQPHNSPFNRFDVAGPCHRDHDVRRVDPHDETVASEPLAKHLDRNSGPKSDVQDSITWPHCQQLRNMSRDRLLAPA